MHSINIFKILILTYQKKEEFELSNNQKYLKEMGLDVEWYLTQNNINSEVTSTNIENISTLRKKVMHCKICNLSLTRKNSVFGEGNLKTNIMIIGEAPGREEDESGTPFVGRAGKLLDEILFYLGLIYFELNNFGKSDYFYNKFLNKNPNSITALYNIASLKQSMGKIQAAQNIYYNLIEKDKNKVRPYYGLFTLNSNNLRENDFKAILKIKNNFENSIFEKGIINYLLSKKEQKNNQYSKEIEYLRDSHDLIFNSKRVYNTSSQFYYNKILNKFFNKIEFSNNKKIFVNDKIYPIFIIGLPRSGSTLIEAIISSSDYKNINSLGECHVINTSIFEQIGPKIYRDDFNLNNFSFEINLKILSETINEKYLNFNIGHKSNKQILIDKSLENFFNIDAILNIYPNAKFLHTFRNPLDSIISIYQSMLPELSWAHSIENIINYIDTYINVIDFYKNKYPDVIMDINLEQFTQNSEKISKEIYNFCRLNWNKKVLEFYKRKNLNVKTLSFTQIRNKVSKYNKKKYMPYFHLLNKYKMKFDWLNIK